jgi:predicted aminopeptidase
VQAGLGQLAIYNHERPITEVIDDPRTPERVREQLKWVPEIKKLVEDEMGVKATTNYTTYVELRRRYVTWALSVAEPYELKLHEWSFPFVGSFPYLGFFNEGCANDWAADSRRQGLDAYVRGVSAYSTLGYLRDPLLSSMLTRRKGDIVNLIFHESTHGQIYLKGQGAFNEQVASYFGDYGERNWIVKTYGEKSPELADWEGERHDRRRFGELIRAFSEELKRFYAQSGGLPDEERRAAKDARFAAFREKLAAEKWRRRNYGGKFAQTLVNNAALLAELTYEDEQDLFDLLNEKCGGRLKDALRFVKKFGEDWESGDRKVKPQVQLRSLLTSVGDTGRAVCLDVHGQ